MKKLPQLLLLAALALTPSARAITYATWIASYGLTGGDALATADPDQDGMPNLMEYALDGKNPTVSDPTVGTPSFAWGTRTLNDLPSVNPAAITWSTASIGTGKYHVGLRYRPRAGTEGILYLVEYSDPINGLYRWFSGRSIIVTRTDYPVAGDNVGWVLQLFDAVYAKRLFFRLRVEVAP